MSDYAQAGIALDALVEVQGGEAQHEFVLSVPDRKCSSPETGGCRVRQKKNWDNFVFELKLRRLEVREGDKLERSRALRNASKMMPGLVPTRHGMRHQDHRS
jgi:hypothetical protein